jgi:hypothetical protein
MRFVHGRDTRHNIHADGALSMLKRRWWRFCLRGKFQCSYEDIKAIVQTVSVYLFSEKYNAVE